MEIKGSEEVLPLFFFVLPSFCAAFFFVLPLHKIPPESCVECFNLSWGELVPVGSQVCSIPWFCSGIW